MNSLRLHEKYRPRTLDAVVGQEKACAMVARIIANGAGGRAYAFTGPSGCGKSTLAGIVAESIADPSGIVEVVGRQLTPSRILELADGLRLYGFGKGGRAIVVNEMHGLSRGCIEVLLDVLDTGRIPAHACWCFTTTWNGADRLFDDQEDAGPLMSRCAHVPLTNQGLAAKFAAYVQTVAQAEGLDGSPLAAYVKLMQRPDVKNNCRAALQMVELGAMVAGEKGGAA